MGAGLRLHCPRGEGGKRFESSFPVHHPWWFRQIKPSGWKEVKQGLQWTYKDFKSKVPIEIAYYMTQVPQVPDEVDPFLNRFLEELKPAESPITELNHLKQILLATYGKEPDDDVSKAFALQQRWCAPNKDFSLDRLSETQRAVLKKIEARIQSSAVGK
jgi:hypothetical protein